MASPIYAYSYKIYTVSYCFYSLNLHYMQKRENEKQIEKSIRAQKEKQKAALEKKIV